MYSLELRRIMALRQTYSSLCSLSSLTRDVAAISISKISEKPCTQLPSSLARDTGRLQIYRKLSSRLSQWRKELRRPRYGPNPLQLDIFTMSG